MLRVREQVPGDLYLVLEQAGVPVGDDLQGLRRSGLPLPAAEPRALPRLAVHQLGWSVRQRLREPDLLRREQYGRLLRAELRVCDDHGDGNHGYDDEPGAQLHVNHRAINEYEYHGFDDDGVGNHYHGIEYDVVDHPAMLGLRMPLYLGLHRRRLDRDSQLLRELRGRVRDGGVRRPADLRRRDVLRYGVGGVQDEHVNLNVNVNLKYDLLYDNHGNGDDDDQRLRPEVQNVRLADE